MPDYLISQTSRKVVLCIFEGVITTYTEPDNYENTYHRPVCSGKKTMTYYLSGVAALAAGLEQKHLEAEYLLRRERKAKWEYSSR